MHEARKREEDRDRHPREHVDAEHERHVLHVGDIGAEHKDGAEPRRDGLAVVKPAHQGIEARRRTAREDGKEEEEVEETIHRRRVHRHAVGAETAAEQEDEAEEEEDPRGCTAAERDHVIEVLVDAHCLRRRLRDEHTDDVSAECHDEAEVEHGACEREVPLREELTGLCRPVPLKDGVAHDRPHDEERERNVGERAPDKLFHDAVLPSRCAAPVRTTSSRNA